MLIASLVFIGIAALIHGYIFILESFLWMRPATMKKFSLTSPEAAQTKLLAFNQGFYNLFIGVMAALGVVLIAANEPVIGHTLILAGAGSMVLAGLVLICSDRTKARAGLTQLAAPLIGLLLLAFS